MKYLDPEEYSLKKRVVLAQKDHGHIAIIINRKSRIIMKDGLRILEQAKQIHTVFPAVKISVETTAPICSKTKIFLSDHKIIINKL